MCAALFGLMAVCSTMVLPERPCRCSGRCPRGQSLAQERGPVEKDVEVPVRRRLGAGDALNRAERAGNFLGDDLRRLPQPPRELERERQREIPQRPPWRHLDDERRRIGGADAGTVDPAPRESRRASRAGWAESLQVGNAAVVVFGVHVDQQPASRVAADRGSVNLADAQLLEHAPERQFAAATWARNGPVTNGRSRATTSTCDVKAVRSAVYSPPSGPWSGTASGTTRTPRSA